MFLGKRLINTGGGDSVPTVVSPTGRTWMAYNIGATAVATSNQDQRGNLYQWGRLTDGHEIPSSCITTGTSSTDVPTTSCFLNPNSVNDSDWRNPSNNNLWQPTGFINNPCPEGFRLPTLAEWTEEIATWSTPNMAGGFNSVLKLPYCKVRATAGNVTPNNTIAYYWSSTTSGVSRSNAIVFINANNYAVQTQQRAFGCGIRAIKDE